MNIVTGLRNELFRPLVQILVPGTVALAPYALIAAYYNPKLYSFWDKHANTFGVLALVAVIAAGFLLEDIGSKIELHWDKVLNKEREDHNADWKRYLSLRLKDEIIGQRYLERVVLRMKFELSLVPALVLALLGILWLNLVTSYWSWLAVVIAALLMCLLIWFVWTESYKSANVASETRKVILGSDGNGLHPSS